MSLKRNGLRFGSSVITGSDVLTVTGLLIPLRSADLPGPLIFSCSFNAFFFFSTLVQSVCLGFVKNVLLACQTLKAFCLKSQSGWETGTYLEQGGKLSWVLDCWWVHGLTELCLLSPLKVKNKLTRKQPQKWGKSDKNTLIWSSNFWKGVAWARNFCFSAALCQHRGSVDLCKSGIKCSS